MNHLDALAAANNLKRKVETDEELLSRLERQLLRVPNPGTLNSLDENIETAMCSALPAYVTPAEGKRLLLPLWLRQLRPQKFWPRVLWSVRVIRWIWDNHIHNS